MLRDDIIAPSRATTEPSEHKIAHFRSIIREFTVNELLQIIERVDRMWSAMFASNLKSV